MQAQRRPLQQFGRIYSYPVEQSTGLKCDQTIMLVTPNSNE